MEDKTLQIKWQTIFTIACVVVFFVVTIAAIADLPDLTPVLLGETPVVDNGDGDMSTDHQQALININTATKADLLLLDGIGETLADRIIAYRETNGAFQKPQDLLNVQGIGEKKLAALLDKITV